MKQLEVGKEYTTVGGYKVTISDYDPQYRHPFFGLVKDADGNVIRPCSYTPWGFYSDVCPEFNINQQ